MSLFLRQFHVRGEEQRVGGLEDERHLVRQAAPMAEHLHGHCHVVDRWADLRVDQAGEGLSGGSASLSCKGHRYPVEVISHCVWLHFRFPLSFREIEELMLERGIVVSYERCAAGAPSSGGPTRARFAAGSPRPGDTWHLGEVLLRING